MKLNSIKILFLIVVILFSTSFNSFSQKKKKDKNQLSEKQQIEFTAKYIEANKQKLLGNYQLAEALYAGCLEIDEHSAACYFDLANIYLNQKDVDKAIYFARAAVNLNEDNFWYQIFLANLYKEKGLLGNATEVLEKLIKNDNENIDLYYDLASLYIVIGKNKEALNTLNEIEKRIGVNEQISLEKERIYSNQGNFNKSIEEIEKLIAAFPNDARYYGVLAEIYVSQNNLEKAGETYQKLLEKDPENGIAHLAIADFYRITNEKDKMIEHLKKAFASFDVETDMKVQMLASFYSVVEQSPELKEHAYELIKILLETNPDEPKAHTIYADYLVQDKKYEEAIAEYKIVTNTVKDKYVIWEQLLFLEGEVKDYKSQFNDSKEALEYFPDQSVLYLLNGIAALELKEYNASIESLNNGLTFAFEKTLKANFYTYLGEAYHKIRSDSLSDSSFDKVLEINSNDVHVLNNYSYYLSIRGENLGKAEEMSKKCVEIEPNNYTFIDTYAWVLFKLNKLDEAKIQIEKAIESGGKKSATIVEHYGDILYNIGEKDKAIAEWKKAKEIGGNSSILDEKINTEKYIENVEVN